MTNSAHTAFQNPTEQTCETRALGHFPFLSGTLCCNYRVNVDNPTFLLDDSLGTWGNANYVIYYTGVRLLESEGAGHESTHIILILGRVRQEDLEFKASLHWLH